MINSGSAPLVPQKLKSITRVQHTDTKFDPAKGFIPNPQHLVSITSRCPAHAEWAESNFGVNVKVDLKTDTTT